VKRSASAWPARQKAGFDTNTFYLPDSPVIGALVWGDVEFGITNKNSGKKSFVSSLVSQRLTKMISVAPLINENFAGVCGHLFSLTLGSVDNTRRFEGDTDRLSVTLRKLDALPVIGGPRGAARHRTRCSWARYQGGPAGYLQYSFKVGQLWLSRDPVALRRAGAEGTRPRTRRRRRAAAQEPILKFTPRPPSSSSASKIRPRFSVEKISVPAPAPL